MTSRTTRSLVALLGCVGCGTDPSPEGPPLTGEAFTLRWGPVLVEPGTEGTQCMILDVGNESAIGVHELSLIHI